MPPLIGIAGWGSEGWFDSDNHRNCASGSVANYPIPVKCALASDSTVLKGFGDVLMQTDPSQLRGYLRLAKHIIGKFQSGFRKLIVRY